MTGMHSFFLKKNFVGPRPIFDATDCSCFGFCVSFLTGSDSFLLACGDPEGHIWCGTCLFYQ